MGNSAGRDRGQGEDCVLIKKGNYARMLPEGADSVTPRPLGHVADRRLPFLTTATVCSTVHTLIACLCHVSVDAVHHGRRRLLLYCSCAALRYFTRSFCLNKRDLIFFTGVFFSPRCIYYGHFSWKGTVTCCHTTLLMLCTTFTSVMSLCSHACISRALNSDGWRLR